MIDMNGDGLFDVVLIQSGQLQYRINLGRGKWAPSGAWSTIDFPGELATDTDIDLAIDQLAGPLYYRVLVTRQDAPPSFTETLVNRYLAQTRGHGPQGD